MKEPAIAFIIKIKLKRKNFVPAKMVNFFKGGEFQKGEIMSLIIANCEYYNR